MRRVKEAMIRLPHSEAGCTLRRKENHSCPKTF